jgi:hypothetical protein
MLSILFYCLERCSKFIYTGTGDIKSRIPLPQRFDNDFEGVSFLDIYSRIPLLQRFGNELEELPAILIQKYLCCRGLAMSLMEIPG